VGFEVKRDILKKYIVFFLKIVKLSDEEFFQVEAVAMVKSTRQKYN